MRRREGGIVRDGGRRQLRPGPEAGGKSPVVAVAAPRVQHAHPTAWRSKPRFSRTLQRRPRAGGGIEGASS
jgi:hypothetical protein